jgi:uncharacterized protein YbjT (DUF2867 family)
VEIVVGDLLSPADLKKAFQGVTTAYYLVHNMSSGQDYIEKETESACNFISAAEIAGIDHIIYLGGLADPDREIGSHLRSRIRTGDALRRGGIPVTEFRASLIIGSGSISFEMIRYVIEQLPVCVSRRWALNRTQAIAIQNVLDYLLSALENPACRGRIYEIGGRDVLTYEEAMLVYARMRGLKRLLVRLPWLPLNGMAYLASKLSRVPLRIARPLIEGMRSDSIVSNDLAQQDFPEIQLIDYKTSVRQALDCLTPACIECEWENSRSSFRIRQQGFFVEAQNKHLDIKPEAVFRAVTGLGGENGWLYLDWIWRLRGVADKLVGGPGLRGRKTNGTIREGDILDFYRVELLELGRRMRLRAELKAPGLGWMEWRITPETGGIIALTQIAYFAPKGLAGNLYWYTLLPFHRLVFSGLIKAIAHRAREIQEKNSER